MKVRRRIERTTTTERVLAIRSGGMLLCEKCGTRLSILPTDEDTFDLAITPTDGALIDNSDMTSLETTNSKKGEREK